MLYSLRSLRLPLLIVLSVFFLSGCALYDQREIVAYGHNGRPVPEGAVDSIQPQKTTRTWVLENLGEPDRISTGYNQTEIFTYRFERSVTKRTRVFLLFSYRKTVVEEKHIHIHFVGDIVHKFWRDYELPALPEASFSTEVKPFEVALKADEEKSKIADVGAADFDTTPMAATVFKADVAPASSSQQTLPQVQQPTLQQPTMSQSALQQSPQVKTSPRPVWSAPLDSASNGVDHY